MALAGPRQADGEQACQAVELALTKLRANHELFDGRELGVRHVDASRPGQARAEAARLLSVNRVVGLLVGPGVTGGEEVVAMARAHEAGAVFLQAITEGAPAGVVVLAAGPAARARALAACATTKLKLTRVALVSDSQDAASVAAGMAFADAWGERAGQVRQWQVGAALPSVLGDKPQAIVLALSPAKVTSISWSGHDPNVPLLVLDELTERAIRGAVGEKVAVHFVTDYAPEVDPSPEAAAWRTEFRARYGQQPFRAAALAWDGIELVVASLREKGAGRAALRAQLGSVAEVSTLTGRSVVEKGLARRALFVLRAQGGKREVVWASP